VLVDVSKAYDNVQKNLMKDSIDIRGAKWYTPEGQARIETLNLLFEKMTIAVGERLMW